MAKYTPLTEFLCGQRTSVVPMRFQEIESLLGFALPPVARKHRAWWSNSPTNSVMTKAWLDAGFRSAQVNMAGERLVFKKADEALSAAPVPPLPREAIAPTTRPLVLGRMKGTVTILFDPTEPTGEMWSAQQGRL